MSLQEHADAAFAEYERKVAEYQFTTAGLSANPVLLAHANAAMSVDKTGANDMSPYLAALRRGEPRWEAARNLNIDPREIRKRLQFDKQFFEDVILAEEEAAEQIEAKLWKLATVDEERWAMEKWLKHRYKSRWGEQPQEINVNGKVVHEIDSAPLDEQIKALEATLRHRQEAIGPAVIDAEIVEDGND